MRPIAITWLAVAAALGMTPRDAAGQDTQPTPPLVEQYLSTGRLAEGEDALKARLAEQPDDDQARFSLGVVRFLRGVEGLTQSLHRYGLSAGMGRSVGLPILRLPVPVNADPKTIEYDDFYDIIEDWVLELDEVQETLAKITDTDVKLPLHFGAIRLDLDGDGQATDEETLWRVYAAINRGVVRGQEDEFRQQAESFVIAFDMGDVYWLRGYCHLLAAMGEVYMAHESKELFERTAHLFFPNVNSPYPFLFHAEPRGGFDVNLILDAIAMVHLVRLPVEDPDGMINALEHLEEVVDMSHASWDAILAEKDDDREWVPSPTQTGVIPNVTVTQEMVDGWREFLGQFQDVLAGRRLMPFWRGEKALGVNLRRVFTEPTTFDLVLWVQGSAAVPYLEEGPIVDQDLWRRLNEVFRGQFIGFAIWFN